MIVLPSLSENLSFLGQLACEVIAEVFQARLEFLLEGVEDGMHVAHRLLGLLFVLLDFAKVGKVHTRVSFVMMKSRMVQKARPLEFDL